MFHNWFWFSVTVEQNRPEKQNNVSGPSFYFTMKALGQENCYYEGIWTGQFLPLPLDIPDSKKTPISKQYDFYIKLVCKIVFFGL